MLQVEGTETEWLHYCSVKGLATEGIEVKGTDDEQIP